MIVGNKLLCSSVFDSDITTISALCSRIYSGGTPTTTEDTYWNGQYPWLSSGETSNSYIIKTQKHITDLGVKESSTKLAKKGSVVVASAGQGLTRGQTSLLLIDTYVNQSVIVLEPKKGMMGFLYSNLKGRYEEMRNLSDLDSIRGSLTTKSLGALPVHKVPDEQLTLFERRCAASFALIHRNMLEIESLQATLQHILALISGR